MDLLKIPFGKGFLHIPFDLEMTYYFCLLVQWINNPLEKTAKCLKDVRMIKYIDLYAVFLHNQLKGLQIIAKEYVIQQLKLAAIKYLSPD
jgi:hypothetical protein